MKRVTVIYGGTSVERVFSIWSGEAVYLALAEPGSEYFPTKLDITSSNPDEIIRSIRATKPDIVFNAFHGRYGEDGCIAALLDMMKIPYTHSGVLASAAAMNKVFTKQIFASNGLPVAKHQVIKKTDQCRETSLSRPHVIKPVRSGGSVDLFVLFDENDARQPLKDWNFSEDVDEVLVEEYIPGRELTAAVMGDRVIGIAEIVPLCQEQHVIDYDAKIKSGQTKLITPAPIPAADYKAVEEFALKGHRLLGCRGISRMDIRYDDISDPSKPRIALLEVNSHPGLYKHDCFPAIAASQGVNYNEILTLLIEAARYSP